MQVIENAKDNNNPCSQNPSNSTAYSDCINSNENNDTIIGTAFGGACGLVFICLVVWVIYYYYRYKKDKKEEQVVSEKNEEKQEVKVSDKICEV